MSVRATELHWSGKSKTLKNKFIYDELIHDLCVISVEITKFRNQEQLLTVRQRHLWEKLYKHLFKKKQSWKKFMFSSTNS